MNRDEYINYVLHVRKNEKLTRDVLNEQNTVEGRGLQSPTSAVSTEETKLLMEYMKQRNLRAVIAGEDGRRKQLTLKGFFKMKRNQQVEVYINREKPPLYVEGKVSSPGRDFVMLTSLTSRFWIPYYSIHSANTPNGIPNYTNTHQHLFFDNDLRNKLLHQFGETVSQRDVLRQLFCEDTLATHLLTWKGTWVKVLLTDHTVAYGKLYNETVTGVLTLKQITKTTSYPLSEVIYIKTLKLSDNFDIISTLLKKVNSKR